MISLAYYLPVVATMWRDEAQPAPVEPGIDPATGRAALAGAAPGGRTRPRRAPAAGRRSSSRSSWAARSSSSASSRSRSSTSSSTPPRHLSGCASRRRRAPASGTLSAVRITAKADYAVRAAAELAAAEGTGPVKGERIATAQDIPLKFLENILSELRTAGIVASRRGAEGGYWLDRPAVRDHGRRRPARRRGAARVDPRDGPRAPRLRGRRGGRCRGCGSRCARACGSCSRA